MSLSEIERGRLADIAAVMIPGGAGQPGAEGLALHRDPVDAVLRIDTSRLAPLAGFLAQVDTVETLADVEVLAQADPEGFQALSVVLANAYFMHPETRAAIGYPGQEARDSSVGLSGADEALVRAVSARGQIFRDA